MRPSQAHRDRQILHGALLGLVGAAIFVLIGGRVPAIPRLGTGPDHGPLLPDNAGAIEEMVIQYVPEAGDMVAKTYAELLRALPPEVTVYAVCPDLAAYTDLCLRLGEPVCRPVPILVNHAMTPWSRDRWLALAPAASSFGHSAGPATLLSPREEDASRVWAARAGDQRLGDDLGQALGIGARRSRLEFDGGDFVADSETVFVTPRVVRRNVPNLVSLEELHAELTRVLQRRVVILKDAPDHHAGMYLALADTRTALVGDPSLGRALLPAGAAVDTYDFTDATQALFDSVAKQVTDAGYRVVRMPLLPGRDGRTYETPLNSVLETRGGQRIVYMPVYRHNPALARAAAAIWSQVGFLVREIDCTETYRFGGSLRCLVNVLRRDLTPSGAA